MASRIAELRASAKELGIPFSELRGLTQEEEIQAVIDRHSGTTTTRPRKAVAKKKSTTAARKARVSRARKSGTARKSSARKSAPARSAKTGTAKRQATAKKTTAKRSTARKSTTTARRNSTDNGGRNTLNGVDYSVTDGWNPREGSAPDLILKALKRTRGNRESAFKYLTEHYELKDFVSPTDSRGRRRKKAEMEWQLRYRISRTAWDFAKRTGQHEPSTNRAVYGEGGTGIGVSGGMPVAFRPDDYDGKPVFKRAADRKRTATRKATGASQASRKRTTAKKSSTARTNAKKRSQARQAGRTAAKRKTTARGRK